MMKETSIGTHSKNTWDTGKTLDFEEVLDDDAFTPVHRMRETAKGRRKLYRNGRSLTGYTNRNGSQIPATERRFVCWDGEGVNDGNSHHYVLFGNSDGNHVKGPSLDTQTCLRLLIENADKNAIHFGFAFGYDVNMILKDVSRGHLRILRKKNKVRWKRWIIHYLPRKWFMVTDKYTKTTIKIWDIWSFFMTSFVKACEQYNVDLGDIVVSGKEARGTQTYDDLETEILPYWREENVKAVELANKLREALYAADLYITQWHGPGAIASYSMSQHKMGDYKAEPPKDVLLASQYGYGGGRFELFKIGRANRPVFEYDINSAYPHAIAQLPNLARGEWRHVKRPTKIARFGIYRVVWKVNPFAPASNLLRPMPFFHRDARGQISFPCVNETWVWSPELWGTRKFPGLDIQEGWEFHEASSEDRPFSWLAQNYDIRQRYKRDGNAAQLALKLQMNSMYGKMAQRVGWNEEHRTAPKWHQLEWAGWVTAFCRSMVYYASNLVGSDIVAFETDAIFTTKPIESGNGIVFGTGLGNWEATTYDDFVYLQSGCRFGLNPRESGKLKVDGWQEKYRGFDKGSLSVEMALEALRKEPSEWAIEGSTSRFVGFAQALHSDFDSWRTFQSGVKRTLSIGGEGKRKHNERYCRACIAGKDGTQTFHDAILTNPIGGPSEKHYLPWKDETLLETQQASDDMKWEVQ